MTLLLRRNLFRLLCFCFTFIIIIINILLVYGRPTGIIRYQRITHEYSSVTVVKAVFDWGLFLCPGIGYIGTQSLGHVGILGFTSLLKKTGRKT